MHRHKWNRHGICMNDCVERLSYDDIERRLNATDALSAEDAISCADDLRDYRYPDEPTYQPDRSKLRDYARILSEDV